jgi:hypothetical protein
MEDLELKELARNIGIWLFVLIVFGSLFVIILINKFGVKDISINQAIDKEDELVVLVLNTDTKNRNEIKKCLNENNVSYKIVYKNRERYFDDFLLKLDLEEKDIVVPTIIYIKDQKANSILVDIKDIDDLYSFLEYNNLLSGKGR